PHLEDAALDVSRLPGLQDLQRAGCQGHRPAVGVVRGRPDQDRRPHDRRGTAAGDPATARGPPRRQPARLRRAARDLRRARGGQGDPPAARLPGDRDLRALDRGDRRARDPPGGAQEDRRARTQGSQGLVTVRAPKGRVPLWRWTVWWLILAFALVLFYVILTPVWMGLRALAWLADFRARPRPGHRPPVAS